MHLWLHAETRGGNQVYYSNHSLPYSCGKSLSLNLEPGWQPEDASNPLVCTLYSTGVIGFWGSELRTLRLHRKSESPLFTLSHLPASL